MQIRLFNKLYYITAGKKELPTLSTTGLVNKTEDRRFVLFADYDLTNLQEVEEDALFLQNNFDIGDMIIISTSTPDASSDGTVYNNYHLIGFTKIDFPELLEMLKYLRCDKHFKSGWKYQHRCWVLRLTEKKDAKGNTTKRIPKLVSILPSNSKRIYSRSHVNFFEKYYDFTLKNNHKMFDNSKEVQIINYVTK